MRRLTLALLVLLSLPLSAETWQFAVAGDSRNCGDVVMPAIAEAVRGSKAAFYWHLGDFRALSDFDQDMQHAAKKPMTILSYAAAAWPDFLRSQIAPFAPTPVYLGIGNHELVQKTRGDYVAQFADWLTQPAIQTQRLSDDPNDHIVRPYYHWVQGGTDFVSLDNASTDMFDEAQMAWLNRLLDRDATNPAIKTVVLGMHAALPHSLGCDHSMNEWAQGESSGSRVYRRLLDFRQASKKKVYVLASHSHFLMRDIFDSEYWRSHGGVLPGIIIGTAGAVRYRLPDTALGFPPERARTDVYGFLLASVRDDGSIDFDFRKIERAAVPASVEERHGKELVDWCFNANRDPSPRSSAPCAAADAPCGPTRR